MERAKQSFQSEQGVGGREKRGGEWTEALRELTGNGQCTANRGAHVHDEHVVIGMEP